LTDVYYFSHTDDSKMTAGYAEQLLGHSDLVSRVSFSPDGTLLASASADKTGRVWRIGNDKNEHVKLQGHKQGVSDICWHPNQQYVATGADDLTLGIWDASTGTCLRILEGHTHFVYCCKFHNHGSVLV
jgi:COMPASS component SWD3